MTSSDCDNGEIMKTTTPIYAVDVKGNYILVGGKDENAAVYTVDNGDLITIVADLEESVMFCKMLDDHNVLYLVVTNDGLICLMKLDQSVEITKRNEAITTCKYTGGELLIGTETGQIHVLSKELLVTTTLSWNTPIKEVEKINNYIFGLVENALIVGDVYGNIETVYDVHGIQCFQCINKNIIAIGTNTKFLIYCGKKLLFELDTEAVETIAIWKHMCILGGEFNGLKIINMNNYSHYTILMENIYVRMIKYVCEFVVIYITYDNFVGVMNIRDKMTLRLLDPELGDIYDIAYELNMQIINIVIGGEYGYKHFVINIP